MTPLKLFPHTPRFLHCRLFSLFSSQFTNPFEITHTNPNSLSLNPCYTLLNLCNNLSSLKIVHSILVVHKLTDNLMCGTKLVSLYGSFGQLGYARKVFDKIPNPDLYCFKVMIRWYFLNELHSETLGFYGCLRKSVKESDDVVFAIVLKACCELRDVDEGRKVHCDVVKSGCNDSFVFTSLVDMYAKCGEIECSYEVFGEIEERNVVSWTSLIAGYVQNDCVEEGLILFNRMRESLIDGNQFTLGSVIAGCGKLGALHQGKWLHGYVVKSGINLNLCLATTLLDMYVKCGNIRDARCVFDELSVADVVSWTAMIVGYSQHGKPNEALKLFVERRRVGISPNSMTVASVLSACAQAGNLNLGRSVHCIATKSGLEEVAVNNALIDMYSKCGVLGDAYFMFESSFDKNIIAWNSMISGYSQNGYPFHALELFRLMRLESLSPDEVTLVSLITACASISAIKVGSSLHAYFIKEGISFDHTQVGTSLLNFYAKSGDTVSARRVFDEMGDKNTATWSAMISGYGMYGDGDQSIELFNDMLKKNVAPNDIIFTTVLSACSHSGKVGDGWKYFTSMCREYNFVPSMKHYACMVDIFARAGRLEEAIDFIEKMPIQPDITVLGAFVHGCSLHSRFELGEIAARRMLDMHPNEACYYVLLYKLYASEGIWDKADEVRYLMKQSGLNKSPGWSSAESDNSGEFSLSIWRVVSAK